MKFCPIAYCWIFFFLVSMNLSAQSSQGQTQQSPQKEQQIQVSQNLSDSRETKQQIQQLQNNPTKKSLLTREDFLPARVISPYYAAFGTNFTYSNFYHPQYFNENSFSSLTFTLDIGWILKENLLLGLYVDGSAGGGKSNALYGMFGGLKIGGRLWDGRVIPYLKLGISLIHFPFELQNQQFNTYGLDAEAGIFFDVSKGYGINLSYRYGFNNAYRLNLSNIHTSIVLIGFTYYDFSLDW